MTDKGKVIAVDLDGTLCQRSCWTIEEARNAIPRLDVIDKVNKIGLLNFIVIFTARRDELIPVSLEWLRKNNVRFHAISNIKMPADKYIDDLAINPEDFLNEKETEGEV